MCGRQSEITAQRLNLDVLAEEDADAAHHTLIALPGIGPWTAAEVALSAGALTGTLAGVPRDRARQVFLREIKAVSHHGLELDLTPGRCRCRLILDV